MDSKELKDLVRRSLREIRLKEEKKKNHSTQDDAPKGKGKSAAQCTTPCPGGGFTGGMGCPECGAIGGGKSKKNPFNTGTGPTKPTTNEEKTCCEGDEPGAWESICCRKLRFGKDSSNSKDRMAKLAGLKNEGDEGKEFTKEELMNEGPELWTILGSLMGIIGTAGITGQLQAMAEDPAIAEKYPKLEKVFSMLAKVGGAVGSGIK